MCSRVRRWTTTRPGVTRTLKQLPRAGGEPLERSVESASTRRRSARDGRQLGRRRPRGGLVGERGDLRRAEGAIADGDVVHVAREGLVARAAVGADERAPASEPVADRERGGAAVAELTAVEVEPHVLPVVGADGVMPAAVPDLRLSRVRRRHIPAGAGHVEGEPAAGARVQPERGEVAPLAAVRHDVAPAAGRAEPAYPGFQADEGGSERGGLRRSPRTGRRCRRTATPCRTAPAPTPDRSGPLRGRRPAGRGAPDQRRRRRPVRCPRPWATGRACPIPRPPPPALPIATSGPSGPPPSSIATSHMSVLCRGDPCPTPHAYTQPTGWVIPYLRGVSQLSC